jgi:hypothetical protein
VGALLSIGIVAIGWFLGASPLLTQAGINDDQVTAIDVANAAQMIEIDQMREDYEGIDELRAELDALQLSIPGFSDTADYFDEIAAKAAAAGVALQTVTVSGAQPYGTMGTSQTSTAPAPAATGDAADPAAPAPVVQPGLEAPTAPGAGLAGNLYVVTVTLAIDADQPRLAAFLAALQGDGRLMLVTDVKSTFGASQRSSLTGYIFVVHDPRLGNVGALPTPTPTESATPAPSESATPTPSPTGTPAP